MRGQAARRYQSRHGSLPDDCAGPAVGPYAFKAMMEVLTGKQKPTAHNIEFPLPWAPYQDIKMCSGESFENSCNVFPAAKVPPL